MFLGNLLLLILILFFILVAIIMIVFIASALWGLIGFIRELFKDKETKK